MTDKRVTVTATEAMVDTDTNLNQTTEATEDINSPNNSMEDMGIINNKEDNSNDELLKMYQPGCFIVIIWWYQD